MNLTGITRSAVALATVFCMLALSFQAPPPAKAAEDDYQRLLPKGMNTLRSAMTWARTGKNTAIVFAVDRPNDSYSINRLISFAVSSSGKTKTAKTFMEGVEGRFAFADAISLASVGSDAPATKSGLLFVAYYMNAAQNKMIFAVAPFDAKGKRTEPFKILKIIEVTSYLRFSNTVIFARAVGDTVGVSLSTAITPATSSISVDSQAFFMETDTTGTLKRGPKAVKLPGGGKLMKFFGMRPAWKYNRWFVPCHRIDFKEVASPPAVDTEPAGSALMIYSAKPKAGGFAIKLKEIESDDQAEATGAYAGIQFLPEVEGSNMPPPPNGLRLFYQKRTFTQAEGPAAEQSLLDYTCKYYHRVVKKTGKALKAVHMASPEWVPELQSEPGDLGSNSEEVISEALVTADGQIVIGMTRYQQINRAASPSSEGTPELVGKNSVFKLAVYSMVAIAAVSLYPSLMPNLCYFNKMLMLGGRGVFMIPGMLLAAYVYALYLMFMTA